LLETFSERASSTSSLPEEDRTHSRPGHIFRRNLISQAAGQKKPEHTHSLDTFSEGASSAMQLARRSQNTLTSWTHCRKEPHQRCSLPEDARTHSHTGHIFRRSLISHAACQKKPEHTHILDTFSEASSAMQPARRSQNTLTRWTHFQKEPHQPCSLPEEARTHSRPGHIFRRSLISYAACQKKPEHTHNLDTFSEGASSAMQPARSSQNTLTYWTHFQKEPHQSCSLPEEARTHSLPGHIFRRSLISHAACQKKPEPTHSLDTFSEGASSAMQLARRSQNTLTTLTHFQKESHQLCSLPEEARTHSHTGHIFRRSLISHAACQKKPEHTHILDTFSEGASSAMQPARSSQNTLTYWTHFQKEPHQPCSLPEDARTHSQPGHIFRRSPISHAVCQKKPEPTHSLDTFSEGASSAMQLARRSQNPLTPWTHFQKEPHQPCSLPEEARTHSQPSHIFRRSLISHTACQKKPEHTHVLDTFSEGASSAMQPARRSQNTLTYWTHFQKEPHQPCSLPEAVRTHSHTGHIFRRSLISHAACQKQPEHTHFLDTFSEGASSAMQPARRSQNTLTSWTHFQKEPHQSYSLPEEARTHSHTGHIFRRRLHQKPDHTHSLDHFQPCSLPEEPRTHSLAGHIFRRSLISHAACQKKPEHTHILDTFSEGASSAMQPARRCQNTLTTWTHFQKALLGTWPGNFEIHSQPEQNFENTY